MESAIEIGFERRGDDWLASVKPARSAILYEEPVFPEARTFGTFAEAYTWAHETLRERLKYASAFLQNMREGSLRFGWSANPFGSPKYRLELFDTIYALVWEWEYEDEPGGWFGRISLESQTVHGPFFSSEEALKKISERLIALLQPIVAVVE